MKYYLIAGEASGDMHGANLMYAIRAEDPNAQFRVWGGDLMVQAGGELVMHYRDIAYMGFVEVIKNLRAIFRNLRLCKEDIGHYQPDALILIDYPGFNMRIGAWASNALEMLKIYYYISPQVWAWKAQRALKLRQMVDKMFVILPFEKDFYQQYDFEVHYVGHPLLDAFGELELDPTFRIRHALGQRPIIAILPGSRRQEVGNHLSRMLLAARHFESYQLVVAGVSTVPLEEYQRQQNGLGILIVDETRSILQHADAAIVASGTATLEAALLDVPQVICYRGSALSYQIAKRLIQVKYISLVNLIVDREIVPELIQYDFTETNLRQALMRVMREQNQLRIKESYHELREILGGPGASKKTATAILSDLK